jgi:hypothetical protein
MREVRQAVGTGRGADAGGQRLTRLRIDSSASANSTGPVSRRVIRKGLGLAVQRQGRQPGVDQAGPITRMVLAKPDLPEPDCENGKHHRQGGQGTAGAQGVAGGQPVQPKQQPLGGGVL